MTQQYDNQNKGAMFKAKDKKTDKHPDRTGEINIVCPHCGAESDHWLAGWLKTSRNGKPFMSLAANPKQPPPPPPGATGNDDFDDDIPF